ncbi:penicillin-binding protein activator [Halomonas halodenitrificans]|uniref:penicillin-binding protein activator n=1 Tax=Halomonas halodenitrificans TaxID=28252 RepID=UPI00048968BA|nr:penicillin-binding protein activator [Halomonas halodenitrificans]
MRTLSRGLLATALLALLLAGCAYQPGVVQRVLDDDPATLLEQAQQQEPAQAARSRLDAADILARQGNRTQALEIARQIDSTRLSGDQLARWALLLADLGESQGNPQAVIQATQNLDDLALNRGQTLAMREQRGMALLQVDEPLAAARALLRVQSAADDEALNDPIWSALGNLGRPALARLGEQGDALTRGWVELSETVRNGDGNIERLFVRLDEWRDRHPRHPAARRLPADLIALRELSGQEVQRIAVLLPESGPLSRIAEAIRAGIRTRHDLSDDTNIRLSFIDSASGNLESLYQKAKNRDAQVVIGPLDKDRVSELEQHGQVPLPTLALNYGRAATNEADGLFEYGLSAEHEAEQAARRAWADDHRRAALLVPDNDWGRRVGEAFWNEWRALGGEVTKAVRYNPGAAATESTRRAIAETRPDLLFMLALPEYARQVPPTLDYYGAGNLPVYATSHLFSGRLTPRLDSDLDDVLFLDIPWQIPDAAAGGEDALAFTASYHALHEETDPNLFRLSAMGVDAFELARRLPQFQLVSGSELRGATGTLRLGQDGRLQRTLPWARFVDGVPQPVLTLGVFGDERAP